MNENALEKKGANRMIPDDTHLRTMDIALSFAVAATVFLSLLQFVVLAEVILSWTPLLFGRAVRIGFISNIVEPMAESISRVVPSRFGMIDLSRLYLLLLLEFAMVLVRALEPAVSVYFPL